MPEELHDALADALVDVLKGLGVTTYKWVPRSIKGLCAVVEPPTLTRTGPDEPEDHIGARDFRFDFPVAFRVQLNEKPRAKQANVIARVMQFTDAIDNLTPGNSGLVLNELCTDAKVAVSTPFVQPGDEGKHFFGYETHVSILTFK